MLFDLDRHVVPDWHVVGIGATIIVGIGATGLLAFIGIVLVACARDAYVEDARRRSAYSEGPPFAKYDLRFWMLLILGAASAAAMLLDAPRIALVIFFAYLLLAAPILMNMVAVILRMAQAVWCRLRKRVHNPLLVAYETAHNPHAVHLDNSICRKYAWGLPTPAALSVVARHGPIVEVGSGTGYWAWLLFQMGADIIAYDMSPGMTLRNHFHGFKPGFYPVHKCDAEEAARKHPDRTLLLCWPSDTTMASRALSAYGGGTVIYIGFNSERQGVYTGDKTFHKLLSEQWTLVEEHEIPSWYPCRDCLRVYRRKQ